MKRLLFLLISDLKELRLIVLMSSYSPLEVCESGYSIHNVIYDSLEMSLHTPSVYPLLRK